MSRREGLLIRRLRERDAKAFREVVRLYRDRVFNLTYRMLGNREEAEDLTQEVFISVFKSIDSFRGDSQFSTWLLRIAANHCKNRLKYLARRYEGGKREYDEQSVATQGKDAVASARPPLGPRAQLEAIEMEQLLQAAIRELDEDQRLLVILRDIQSLSYEEICKIVDLPAGTVKSRLHRARMALRKKMAKHV